MIALGEQRRRVSRRAHRVPGVQCASGAPFTRDFPDLTSHRTRARWWRVRATRRDATRRDASPARSLARSLAPDNNGRIRRRGRCRQSSGDSTRLPCLLAAIAGARLSYLLRLRRRVRTSECPAGAPAVRRIPPSAGSRESLKWPIEKFQLVDGVLVVPPPF